MVEAAMIEQSATRNRVFFFADMRFAVLLLVVLAVVYAPSLQHVPRADQWCFLVDTIDQHDFRDILAHSYSYNRTRHIMPGDAELYRPILFAVLSAEKAVFAANFAAYQAVGIFLHWGLVCTLLLLLRTILAFDAATGTAATTQMPSWSARLLPYGVCLFFALNKSVQELVIWTHLHGYLLFLIMLLASLTLLLRWLIRGDDGKSLNLWGAWILALLSAFTYEMGQLYALLAGLFVAVVLPRGTLTKRRLALCALFAAVPLVYQSADRLDRLIHQGQFNTENVRGEIAERALSKNTLVHAERFAAYTVAQPFFPSLWKASYRGGRMFIGELDWSRVSLFERFHPALTASLLVSVLAVGLAAVGLARLMFRRDKRSLLMFAFGACLYGVYLTMSVLGRMNLRPGAHCLAINCYYAHVGLLLALVPVFVLWQAAGRNRAAAAAQSALLFGLIALSVYDAPAVWGLNESMAHDMRGCRQPIAALRDFVQQHRSEEDFTMAIDFSASDDVGTAYDFPIPMIVFKRWLHPHPKYIVTLCQGQVRACRGD